MSNGFSQKKAVGRMPVILPDPCKLNLGCGLDIRGDYINIDLFSDNPLVVYGDVRQLELQDNTVDEILASDILEHFPHAQTDAILKEWARVLKPDGLLEIRCPSLKLQAKAYIRGDWDADIASYMIFGGQTNPGNFHCVGFDEISIQKHLEKAGFKIISIQEHDYPQDKGFINLNMSVKALKISKDKENISSDSNVLSENSFGLDFSIDDTANNIKPDENNNNSDDKTFADLNIVWEGSQFIWHSLALINREHCLNIIDSNSAHLSIVPYENDQFQPDGNKNYEKLKSHDVRYDKSQPIDKAPFCWIRHQWPPNPERPKGAKWIVMQPWEFGALRKDFKDIFDQVDEIWTPSTYSRKSFLNSGIDSDKVQVIPNGINPAIFSPAGKKYELKTNKTFKFLFIGGTTFRKGIDILLKAYTAKFTAQDDVCLIIKDLGSDSFYKGQSASSNIKMIQNAPDAPEIIYIDEYLKEEEIASLYRACDLFVSPYRGEGFSLPTLEAMACGLPVVVTKGGATDDFIRDDCAWMIPAEKRSIGSEIDGLELAGEGYLLEPDKEILADLIRSLYENPKGLKVMGLIGSWQARHNFNWKKATVKLLNRLDLHYGTNMAQNAEEKLPDIIDEYIHAGYGEKYFSEGNFDKALEYYLSSLDFDSKDVNLKIHVLCRLAEISAMDGDFEKVKTILDEAEKLDSSHPDTIFLKARNLADRGLEVEAMDTVSGVLDRWMGKRFESTLGHGLDQILSFTADLILRNGDPEGAKEVYSEALKYNPENEDACFGSAICFRAMGAEKEAITMLEWAVRINPDFEYAKKVMAEIKGETE